MKSDLLFYYCVVLSNVRQSDMNLLH